MTEITWPKKPKIFMIWPFRKHSPASDLKCIGDAFFMGFQGTCTPRLADCNNVWFNDIYHIKVESIKQNQYLNIGIIYSSFKLEKMPL